MTANGTVNACSHHSQREPCVWSLVSFRSYDNNVQLFYIGLHIVHISSNFVKNSTDFQIPVTTRKSVQFLIIHL